MQKIGFAIVDESYLPYAYVTRDSFLTYNPDYHFFIFIHGQVSNTSIYSDLLVGVEDFLGKEKFGKINPDYSIFERSCALKSILVGEIFDKWPNCKRITYVDSDLYFMNSFPECIELDTSTSIFLTPHTISPIIGVSYLTDISILFSGVFNAGFFQFNNNEESRKVLAFLNEYMYQYCTFRKKPFPSIFVDQIYYDLIPSYFDSYRIIKHRGYNLSFHNLHERGINLKGSNWQTDQGEPVIFFHFTGLDFFTRYRCSKYYDFDFVSNYPDLNYLLDHYIEALLGKNLVFQKKLTQIQKFVKRFKC